MTEETVKLADDRWTQLLDIVASAAVPWRISNPLIQDIGRQLQLQRKGDGAYGGFNAQRSVPNEDVAPAGGAAVERGAKGGAGRASGSGGGATNA